MLMLGMTLMKHAKPALGGGGGKLTGGWGVHADNDREINIQIALRM